jgi:tRNA nucleotidyltransferase/poly(A) polymerase
MTAETIERDKIKLEQFLEALHVAQINLNARCYFVGGCVRDHLLGHESADYDLAVDGDLKEIIQALSEAYVLTPSILGTAKIRFGKYHVDLATFRSERYASNNGLPKIASGDIETDLSRRDFTINTGYVMLTRDNLEKMLRVEKTTQLEMAYAHPNFYSDIQNGILRVLHERSFIEDPSRMLRAVKYSTLYPLNMDDVTQALFNTAIKEHVIANYSKDRYRQIVFGYARHEQGIEILTNLFRQSLLQQIEVSESSNETRIQAYHDNKLATDSDIDLGILYLLLIYEYQLAFWIGADRHISEVAKACISIQDITASQAPLAWQSRWWGYETFKRYDDSVFSFVKVAVSIPEGVKSALRTYLEETQFIKLNINGKTLIDRGMESGKKIGLVLNLLLAHKVESGQNMTQEEEIKWIESKQYEY